MGAALDLVEKSRSLESLDSMQLAFLQRDWQLLRDRLAALRNASPAVTPDNPGLIAGITDADDLAERWVTRTDLWAPVSTVPGGRPALEAEVKRWADVSEKILTHDAGQIR